MWTQLMLRLEIESKAATILLPLLMALFLVLLFICRLASEPLPPSLPTSWIPGPTFDFDQTPWQRWEGATCMCRRITGLNLDWRGLSGYSPRDIGAIVTLGLLTLSFNNFSKPILLATSTLLFSFLWASVSHLPIWPCAPRNQRPKEPDPFEFVLQSPRQVSPGTPQ